MKCPWRSGIFDYIAGLDWKYAPHLMKDQLAGRYVFLLGPVALSHISTCLAYICFSVLSSIRIFPRTICIYRAFYFKIIIT